MSDLISRADVICGSEVKCLSCGHHVAERPFEVYCNIMCKWVNEKDYCTLFEGEVEKDKAVKRKENRWRSTELNVL